MKRLMMLTLAAAIATVAVPVFAQTPGTNPSSPGFVDKDGDGICDNYQGGGQGQAKAKGKGPGNGTGNQGVGPRDGTGYGAGNGTGNCDGTGPKGQAKRRGGRS
jgi:hypothetical protein